MGGQCCGEEVVAYCVWGWEYGCMDATIDAPVALKRP